MTTRFSFLSLFAAVTFGAGITSAGPIIVDGTDANDHGSFNGSVNVSGWEYMQRAFENIGPAVTNGQNRVVTFGVNSSTALSAVNSAFNLSTLPGAGWTMQHIIGAANIANFLTGGTVAGANLSNTGIIHLTTSGHTGGDMTSAELAAINANAGALNSFVGGGGGFWSMGETGTGAYGWLSALLPGIQFFDFGDGTPITLTAAGSAAFPGLTNSDLAGATPWHTDFAGNFGGLVVLGEAQRNATIGQSGPGIKPVILGGGGGGTFTTPAADAAIPEPSTVVLFGLVMMLGAVGYWHRRRSVAAAMV